MRSKITWISLLLVKKSEVNENYLNYYYLKFKVICTLEWIEMWNSQDSFSDPPTLLLKILKYKLVTCNSLYKVTIVFYFY